MVVLSTEGGLIMDKETITLIIWLAFIVIVIVVVGAFYWFNEPIKKLIDKWACKHDYQLVKQIADKFEDGVCGYTFIYKCTKCGKFKTINT